ncbi:MAG: hypothetical protein ACT4QC_15635 [Planctomycetaceae bacterium]
MNDAELETQLLTVDRRSGDRRLSIDRRAGEAAGTGTYVGEQRRGVPRRKVERRRQIDPTTCERDYTPEEIEFMRAMDEYKRRAGRQFPTWSEVLEVLKGLGYKRE